MFAIVPVSSTAGERLRRLVRCNGMQARDAEVEDLEPAVRRPHQVAGFQIEVDHTRAVRGDQRFGELRAEPDDFGGRQRIEPDVAQRHALRCTP